MSMPTFSQGAGNFFATLFEPFTDPQNAWRHFQSGNSMELANAEAEKQRLAEAQNTQAVNDTNKAIADSTNQLNRDIANENLAFQRENQEYIKALNQQVFEREDTAYQRTASDMAKAGLNPLTMSGTNGAGTPLPTESANNGFEAQGYNAQKSDAGKIQAQYSEFAALTKGFTDIMNSINSVASSVNDTVNGFAQRDSLRQARMTSELDNDIKLFNLGYHPDRFNSIPYLTYSDKSGKTLSPSEFSGFFNNDDYYNPASARVRQNISEYRDMLNDVKYGLYRNSTPFERNLSAFERSLDMDTWERMVGKISDKGMKLFGLMLKGLD